MQLITIILLSFVYSTVTDIDGNVYETVQIGNQIWMAENLKVTHYNNGDELIHNTGEIDWENLQNGGFCDAFFYLDYLYNAHAVFDNRSICPESWHVPTDEEWMSLEMYLGMTQEEAELTYWRGDDEGGKLKATGLLGSGGYWDSPNYGANNQTGFTGLPAGYCRPEGTTGGGGNLAKFWTSTQSGTNTVWHRTLGAGSSTIERRAEYDNWGFSIRCISNESQSGTILVPENFSTIQEAIDYSIDGDTVFVAAGTYYENINFNGKNISVIGEDRETTIIDGGGNGSVVIVDNDNVNQIPAEISGFTITNGTGTPSGNYRVGGGIFVISSDVIIDNCKITGNEVTPATSDGGGILLSSNNEGIGNAIIRYTEITNNYAHGAGGGIGISNESTLIINSIISNNNMENFPQSGLWIPQGNVTINNSIIWMDSIWDYSPTQINITYSNIQGGWEGEGNIDAYPYFSDSDNGDYALTAYSPCIDAGDPESPLDPDGSIADMGAYPFYHYPFIEFISPTGGETWYVDSTYTIQWEGGNPDGEVEIILLDEDAGTHMDIAITPNNGSYEWVAAIYENQSFGYGTRRLYIEDIPGDNYWGYSNEFVITRLAELGDLTQDFVIDILDIVMLINIIIDYNTSGINPTEQQLELGDINQDGMLNVIDIVGLVNVVLDN